MSQQGAFLTTSTGARLRDTDHSLKAGSRGPTLLQDHHLREKITHFDHERIPERVVHARGAGAHGVFVGYGSAADLTSAAFLDKDVETPVFVRFSTVAGSRGSADTVRDTRGFAMKFYTEEGNFDLVGNNIPVFFIQDGIKFPDIIHAAKPHPDREIPQAQTAHDTFWDFVSLHTEAQHHAHVEHVRPGHPALLPARWRASACTPSGSSTPTGGTTLVKFHWKPAPRRALPDLGGGPDARRHRPRLPPPRPLRRHRGRRLPAVGARHPGLRRTPPSRPSRASTCSTRPRSCPRSSPRCSRSAC